MNKIDKIHTSRNKKDILSAYRAELITMAAQDQHELTTRIHAISQVKSSEKRREKGIELYSNCHRRAQRMREIVRELKEPTITKIGIDGCEAILLLTQHSYLSIMKEILTIFQKLENKTPLDIPIKYIPALIDRILILEKKPQEFGTQWLIDKNSKPFLAFTSDFANVNNRRKKYGLSPVKRPTNLAEGAVKYPLGKGLARQSDMKHLTDEEYAIYAEACLVSLV